MDSGREVCSKMFRVRSVEVSILVLMDSGREVKFTSFIVIFFSSFNPCFNGFRARRHPGSLFSFRKKCFNPCFNGFRARRAFIFYISKYLLFKHSDFGAKTADFRTILIILLPISITSAVIFYFVTRIIYEIYSSMSTNDCGKFNIYHKFYYRYNLSIAFGISSSLDKTLHELFS